MIEHGYVRYGSKGCRCEVCRVGLAAYRRDLRSRSQAARAAAKAEGRRYIAENIAHGLNGYQYYGCRCLACRVSNAAYQAEYRKRKAEKGAA